MAASSTRSPRLASSIPDPASAINDVAPAGAKPLSARQNRRRSTSACSVKAAFPTDAASVLAVVVNITVTEPGANGYLEAYGKGAKPRERTSIINFAPRTKQCRTCAIVRPGADGALTIGLFGLAAPRANVIVDVFGWFSTSNYTGTDGARLIPDDPVAHPRHPRWHQPSPCRRRSAPKETMDAADPRR